MFGDTPVHLLLTLFIAVKACTYLPGTTTRHLATAKWYDRRDSVFVEFCVEDSKDVQVNFDTSKIHFSCLSGTDNIKHQNTVDLFGEIDPKGSKHKRTDRSVLCCLRKAEAGKSWPRLTKDKTKNNWLSVDFSNWKDWEDDSDEDLSRFDKFSEMMNNMGGEDLPDFDAADDEHDSADSDDECFHRCVVSADQSFYSSVRCLGAARYYACVSSLDPGNRKIQCKHLFNTLPCKTKLWA